MPSGVCRARDCSSMMSTCPRVLTRPPPSWPALMPRSLPICSRQLNGSTWGEHARRPLPVIAAVVLLCLVGLFLTGCAPTDSDAAPPSTTETTEDAEARQEDPVELAAWGANHFGQVDVPA